jgi:peptidoglycan/xylan/chitin deacetylase (PgdA/CDA1 family)
MRIGWLWPTLAVGIVASALMTYVAILEAQVGPLGEVDAPHGPLSVAVVESAATTAHFVAQRGADPGAHGARVKAWREALRRLGVETRVVGDAELESGEIREPVIVLPSVAVLSDGQASRLKQLVASGRGVVATWQLGLYRPDQSFRGPEVLRTLFGVSPVERDQVPRPHFFALRTGSPLTAGMPGGLRLEISPYDEPLLLGGDGGDADWVRWEMLAFGAIGSPVRPHAVSHKRIGAGRAVWFDFEPNAATAASASMVESLVRNAVWWAGQQPLGGADLWPNGARVAAVFGLDTEHRFEQAPVVAKLFAKKRRRLTFFCVSDLARANAALMPELMAAGEIGSHTDDHKIVAGRPLPDQLAHLEASAAALRGLGAPRVDGFRAPEEQSDAATMTAALRAGFGYVAGGDKDRTEPVITPEGLVLLPRIPHDDFHWLMKENVQDADVLKDAVREDLEQIERLGGLYFFSFHTQTLDRPALLEALEDLLDRTGRRSVWQAEGRDVASWWRARAGVAVRVDAVRAGRLRVRVTSESDVPTLPITVYPPGVGRPMGPVAEQGDLPTHARTISNPDPAVRLTLENLTAGETRIFNLDPP